jgi:hypothetical protein
VLLLVLEVLVEELPAVSEPDVEDVEADFDDSELLPLPEAPVEVLESLRLSVR